MAGLQFSSGIDRGFERDLTRMNSKLNLLSKNVQSQGKVMDNTFKTVARSVGGLVSVMAVGAAGKELFTFTKDLETALTEVSTISQAVTEDFEGYKDALVELSTESAVSAKSLTDAYYDIVSAGYDGAQGLELLAAAEKASTAGFVEVGTAADGLTTVLNAWGKSASEATAVSDIFFKTVEKGKTTFPELGSNIAQVAPVAASLGVSFEEVSAAAATLTKSGTPTAQAFTQIRASLLAVNEVLGDGWADAYTFQEALAEVRDRAKGSTNELKNMLGRVEAVNAVLGLTGKNASVAASDLAAMNNSLNATAIAAEKVTASTDYQIKNLKNNILAALEPLGSEATKIIGDLAKNLSAAFDSGQVQKYAAILLQLGKVFLAYKVATIAQNQVDKLRKNILIKNIAIQEQMRLEYALSGKTVSKSALRMSVANKTLARSFKELTTAFKANPLGFLATGLMLVLPLIERFRNKTKEATIDQDEFNRSLAETKALLAGFSEIEKTQDILGLLSKEQLEEQKKRIEQQLKREKDNNRIRLEDTKELLKNDIELSELSAKLKDEKIQDVLKASILRQYKRRQEQIVSELQLEQNGANERIRGLNKYYKEVDAAIGNKSDEGTKDISKTNEEQRLDNLKELELGYQEYLNFINSTYSDELEFDKIKQSKLLKADLEYLKEKRKLTKEQLDKIKIDSLIIAKKQKLEELSIKEETTGDVLRNLDIEHQKKINQLTEQYGKEKDAQQKLHDDLIKEDIRYYTEKAKLTDDELEQEVLKYKILQKELQLGEKAASETGDKKDEKITAQDFTGINEAFSATGDNLTNQLANLSTNVVSAFETLNSESSTTADNISGIISLIIAAGNIIKDVVSNAYTKESDDLSDVNNEISKRIDAESTINRLVRERIDLELNSSAFLDANYKDRYTLALQTLNDSESIIADSVDALSKNLVLTATGKGESWLGINETAEDYSFTLDQIINKSDTLSGIELGGTISNILDPADVFGGAASAEAYEDALNKVETAFNSTLKAMGKTAADMANFSRDEWVEFYTILDEGGYIADQGTKALVDGMKEAQEEYLNALEEMKNIISTIAGDLGSALGDSIVDAVANGTDALDEFEKSLNKVFIEMAKAEMNALFFQGIFDTLQEEMRLSMEGGDQNWQDDLLRFYEKLPSAISGAEDFMTSFDQQLKDLGFEGVSGEGVSDLSTAGQISQSITEKTGTILAGHFGAVRLSNERIANYSEDILDLGVQNLVTLNKIKENTDYLPAIAENTKKTYQKLGGV